MSYKILFTDTVDPSSEVENRYPPLGPGYLASYLKKHDPDQFYEFKYVNTLTKSILLDFKPNLVSITSVSQNFERAKKYAEIAKESGLIVIIGGIHISSLPQSLTEHMDLGIIGEGEKTFFEIVSNLSRTPVFNSENFKKIKGICFHENEQIIVTDNRDLLNDNDIPHPMRDLTGYKEHDYIFSSRGCPYKCRFCASTRYWGKIRWLSPEFVIEEICEMMNNGVTMITFYDDLFIANKPRLKKIADLIDEKGINRHIKFICTARANLIDEDTIHYLKKMNVVSVGLGLESGNERVLNYLKGDSVTVNDNKNAVALLSKAKIQANASFIIGSPDETLEEINDTYNFIKHNKLSFTDVYVLTPFPGTPIWDYAKTRGLVSDEMNWEILNVNFEKNFNSAIILSEKVDKATIVRIYKKFRLLRLYKILIALPKSPSIRDVPKILLFYLKMQIRRISEGF